MAMTIGLKYGMSQTVQTTTLNRWSVDDEPLVAARDDDRRPHCMDEHQQDRHEPADAVDVGVSPPAKSSIIPVPIVSQARPDQKKTRCQGFSGPGGARSRRRSCRTPARR